MIARRQTGLKGIASQLGLSVTTVSRALGGHADVSPETRERVAAAAARLGYVPSRAGRMLVSGRSDFIALVVPVRSGQFVDPFLGEFVAGLGEGAVRHGRDLLIAAAARGQSETDVLRHLVDGGKADGIVLARTRTDDERVSYLLDRRIPFVSHGRVLAEARPHVWFDTDGEAAFADAARMLIGLGHCHFGLLTFSEPFTFAALRRKGLEAALAQAGLTLAPPAIAAVERADEAAAAAAAKRLLALDPRPTALLCATDALAIAALKAAHCLRIGVPGEVSVIGFDDVPVAAYAMPALSTFDQKTTESAHAVADMLVEAIERGPEAVAPRLVQADFIPRASHGPAPDTHLLPATHWRRRLQNKLQGRRS